MVKEIFIAMAESADTDNSDIYEWSPYARSSYTAAEADSNYLKEVYKNDEQVRVRVKSFYLNDDIKLGD